MIECPFCGEDDFDEIGLKFHLIHHCDAYDAVDVSGVKSIFSLADYHDDCESGLREALPKRRKKGK